MRFIFIILIIFSIIFFVSFVNKKRAEVVFFDVGQGDSYAFRTNDNKIILIDGGPDWTSLHGLGRWLNFFKRDIEIIILTHTHADHISSLPEIIKRYKVKKIYLPENLDGAESIALINSLSDEVEIIYPEKDLCIDFNSDCSLCIFSPSEKFKGSDDDNDLSLATYFNCSGLTVFGAGDASADRELDLLNSIFFNRADILKISHHGSSASSDSKFLDAVDPKFAIISVGTNNIYKHPGLEVINSLKERYISIWRTDSSHSLMFFSNNKGIIYKQDFP